ncbi:MAG TPA: polysaccharide deacetylase family protein [Vicinamibacterales bacterium]|nr:polysaccharide deacetylase family protein [Vicinamibacterales bacterium]
MAQPRNVFTVDLEEWFHICASGLAALRPDNWDRLPSRVDLTTRLLLDVLEGARVRATFFVVGWVAERHPDLIAAVRRAGHEIGSHSHLHRKVYELDADTFRADLRASLRALAAVGAPRATMFRAPEWSINDRSLWALEVLAREGVRIDASMAPVKLVGSTSYPRYPHVRNTRAGPITEVPPLVADRFRQAMPMGWGWGLRMSSPRRILRTIEAANREGLPAVLTVHPWELDPHPPRVRLPARLQFAHYFRLSGFVSRLREVLRHASFGPIGDMTPASGR